MCSYPESGTTAVSVTDVAPRDINLNTNEDAMVAASMLASHARFKRVFAATVHDDACRLAHLAVLTDSVNATRKCDKGKVAEVCSLANAWRVSVASSGNNVTTAEVASPQLLFSF